MRFLPGRDRTLLAAAALLAYDATMVSQRRLPTASPRRLVDQGWAPLEASRAGRRERYGRGETAHTIHVWWARRPHTAMRALVFAALSPGNSADARRLLVDLCAAPSVDAPVRDEARAWLRQHYPSAPMVLDMFGGGGTIALEALELGARATSVDCNPLAVFVQRSLLVHARRGDNLAPLVQRSGERVLARLAELTMPLFPSRTEAFGYLWTYAHACAGCGYEILLSRRPWLTRKPGQLRTLRLEVGESGDVIAIDKSAGAAPAGRWMGRAGTVQCPRCGHVGNHMDIRACRDRMVVCIGVGSPKEYRVAGGGEVPDHDVIEQVEQRALSVLGAELPTVALPRWSGIVNPPLWGLLTHADVPNRRQRAVIVLLLQALAEEHEALIPDVGGETAGAVVGLLSSLVDQLVDWNCRLSMWIAQNEQVGRAFSGPGVPMLWDYVETDPAQRGPANLRSKLHRVVSGVKFASGQGNPAQVLHAAAQRLPLPDASFDAVVTDPPYYDNLYYSVLADFFYVWKRLVLRSVEPDLFGAERTDDTQELVASTQRCGTPERAHEVYCQELTLALKEAHRVLKPDGMLALVFGHSSARAWEAVIRAFQGSGLTVTAVHPLDIERRQRPRAMTAEAQHACLVLVARKDFSTSKATMVWEAVVQGAVQAARKAPVRALEEAGWGDAEVAVSAFAHGVARLCNSPPESASAVGEALQSVARAVSQAFPDFSLSRRVSL